MQLKKKKNLISGLVTIILTILIGLGCSQFGTNTNSNNTKANKTAGNNSNGNNSNGSNSTSSSDTKLTSNSRDLTGEYAVKGKTPKGDDYANNLSIFKIGDVYEFDWTSPKGLLKGFAVQDGNIVAVSLSSGCGAVIYKANGNKLEGKLTTFESYQLVMQTATPVSQNKTSSVFDLESTEKVNGSNRSNLTIKNDGEFYQFTYRTPAGSYGGKGIRFGDNFAVGVGKRTCAYATYTVENDNLRGIWGTIGSAPYGTEIATRK